MRSYLLSLFIRDCCSWLKANVLETLYQSKYTFFAVVNFVSSIIYVPAVPNLRKPRTWAVPAQDARSRCRSISGPASGLTQQQHTRQPSQEWEASSPNPKNNERHCGDNSGPTTETAAPYPSARTAQPTATNTTSAPPFRSAAGKEDWRRTTTP